ncbi:hypothetical protein F3B52_28720 [Bacteroides ovatus]|uniref:Uncharacterized protein n=3 Tax=root TaxID=1 RepID=A0A642BST6_BACOV|nr:hypothetical protein F3B52_28720 [Bacteroides ovatus]
MGGRCRPIFNEVKIVNHEIMDEVIEAIVNDAVERATAFSPGDQSFIYSEVSDRLSDLSHTALMTEYGFKEEDFE